MERAAFEKGLTEKTFRGLVIHGLFQEHGPS